MIARNKKDFEKLFRRHHLPVVRSLYERDGIVDKSARREEWNNTIDILVGDNELPKRALEWTCPW